MIHPQILDRLSVLTDEEKNILHGSTKIDQSIYMDSERLGIIAGNKLLERGKLISIRPHTRFIAFPEHRHDYVEMIYMCRGNTKHYINGIPIHMKEGELLMLSQNASQRIEAAGENDIAVNFIIRPVFFSGVLNYVGTDNTPLRQFLLDSLQGTNGVPYLYFRASDVLPVQNLIENLLWTMIETPLNKRHIQQTTMGLLFSELLAYNRVAEFSSQDEQILFHVLGYIEEHYRDGKLTDIARMLPYNLTSLSRLISKKTGRSFTALVQEKRISQAAWLLENTDMNVDSISFSVGYENVSYFHRLFAAKYGMSPYKYRKEKYRQSLAAVSNDMQIKTLF